MLEEGGTVSSLPQKSCLLSSDLRAGKVGQYSPVDWEGKR